ncbi:MAG TPA: hypothetical protein VFE05_10680 [Longimicrobiaceae bacterium]|jgi:hypothetical protein|nr:hypothetical protein [Longimicrobiaceae bacterium]
MKKLALDLRDLPVESFPTSDAAQSARGTVLGLAPTSTCSAVPCAPTSYTCGAFPDTTRHEGARATAGCCV